MQGKTQKPLEMLVDLADKASGIYTVLGPFCMANKIVHYACKSSGAINQQAADFASFFLGGELPVQELRLEHVNSLSRDMCYSIGSLLACIDTVLLASDYWMWIPDHAKAIEEAYRNMCACLLQQAEKNGLPHNYSQKADHYAALKLSGLQRPAFAEKGGGNP